MSDKFDTNYLEVGDTFEGGAIEQSYFISAVMAAGGEIEVDGDIVRIVQLPKKEAAKAKASVSEKPVEKAPEPPLVDLAAEEAVVEEAPKTEAPKVSVAKPGPKPKVAETSKKAEA